SELSESPTPRILAAIVAPQPAPRGLMTAFGTNAARLVTSVSPRAARVSPVTAVIASGVSCSFSALKRAGNVTSSSCPSAGAVAAAADCCGPVVWAMAGPAPKPRHTASTGSASGRPIDAKRLQDSDTGARIAHKDRVMADIPPHSRKAARQSIGTMVLRYHR